MNECKEILTLSSYVALFVDALCNRKPLVLITIIIIKIIIIIIIIILLLLLLL